MKSSNILLIRLSSAGDVVLTFPAYFYLKKRIPEAKITWAIDERFENLLDLLPDSGGAIRKDDSGGAIRKDDGGESGIAKVVFPGKTLKKKDRTVGEKIAVLKSFTGALRACKYDIAIDFQGLFKSGLISYLSGAGRRLAFAPGGHDSREMNRIFQTDLLKPDDAHPLSSRIMYRSICLAAAACGESPSMPEIELAVPDADKNKMSSFFDSIKSEGPFSKTILLNPFTNWPTKTWPADKWRALIELAKKSPKFSDALFLIFWGPSEKAGAERIASGFDRGVFLAPDTTLRESFALIGRADAVISGDSFALHAAFISKKPVVAVFGASDPARCAPFGANSRTVAHSLPCQYCFKKTCKFGTNECIEGVKPVSVLDALDSLL